MPAAHREVREDQAIAEGGPFTRKMLHSIISLAMIALLTLGTFGLVHLPLIRRLGVPDVAFFLSVGVGVDFAAHAAGFHPGRILAPIAQPNLLSGAAALIILYGGAELTPAVMRTIWKPVLSLATVAVALSVGILGLLTWSLGVAHMNLFTALLLGAVVAGTDPAVLVSLLDQVPLNERVREMLIAESALNDPMSAMIATTMIAFLNIQSQHHGSVAMSVLHTGMQVAAALVVGVTAGWLARRARPLLPSVTVRTLGLFAIIAAASWRLHANLFLSAFAAGLIAQPLDPHVRPHPQPDSANGGAALSRRPRFARWNALRTLRTASLQRLDQHVLHGVLFADRSYIFLLLGLSFPIHESLRNILLAVGVAMLLIVIARPLSVAGAKLVAGRAVSRHEAAFIACNRQTGVIPALFAADLTVLHVPEAAFISLCVTMTIIVTSVLLLPLFRPLAQTFKLLLDDRRA
ncbi:MAG: cation:proton antiporter domain-containing protein [Bacilli bacterium]